jgi:hypothetical protein
VAIIPWACAHGEAEWVSFACEAMVPLAAADSNRVIVTGRGTILSFGPSPASPAGDSIACTKIVFFDPTKNDEIIITPSAHVALLGSGQRVIRGKSFATFSCDSKDHWTENSFQSLSWGPDDLDELIQVVFELASGSPAMRQQLANLMKRRLL